MIKFSIDRSQYGPSFDLLDTARLSPPTIDFSVDELDRGIDPKFLGTLKISSQARCLAVLSMAREIVTTPTGRVSTMPAGPSTECINQHRTRLGLEPVPALRLVHLGEPPTTTARRGQGKSGWHPRRHAVRAYTRATGKVVEAYARDGKAGDAIATPWYTVIQGDCP